MYFNIYKFRILLHEFSLFVPLKRIIFFQNDIIVNAWLHLFMKRFIETLREIKKVMHKIDLKVKKFWKYWSRIFSTYGIAKVKNVEIYHTFLHPPPIPSGKSMKSSDFGNPVCGQKQLIASGGVHFIELIKIEVKQNSNLIVLPYPRCCGFFLFEVQVRQVLGVLESKKGLKEASNPFNFLRWFIEEQYCILSNFWKRFAKKDIF